ncbi:MAG TPA: hypothetical protein VLJ39_02990, partial [Tepidisphaeraceae bacterium]|nr:hypothetical protein [Tepidisphaeraceae bacterium]
MLMMTFRWLVLVCSVVYVCAVAAAEPAASPAAASTQPVISDRQASILLQLADAEANIKVINQALVRTGYKVGLAYDRIESSEKGNELMDRKGGGPVRWDVFYGKTARDFYVPTDVGTAHARGVGYSADVKVATGLHPIQRPPQFDFIYGANEHQIDKARGQIASLLQNQAALLARRHKHESDQAALWAELAWEQVRDREIAFRPIERFAMKGDAARVALLRGPILFLRVANAGVVDGLDTIEADQSATFAGLHARTKAAYSALQETMAAALLAPNVSATDAKQAADLKASCKLIAEECVVIDDNARKAAESDRANEDTSKLEYRGQLQTSVAKLAILIAGLDDQVTKVASAWAVVPDVGVETPDKIPPFKPTAELRPAVPQALPQSATPVVGSGESAGKSEAIGAAPSGAIDPREWRVWCWSGSRWSEYPLDKMDVRFADGVLRATNTTGAKWPRSILVWRGALL